MIKVGHQEEESRWPQKQVEQGCHSPEMKVCPGIPKIQLKAKVADILGHFDVLNN